MSMPFESIPNIFRFYLPDLVGGNQKAKTVVEEKTYAKAPVPQTGGEILSVTAETYSSDTVFYSKQISEDTTEKNRVKIPKVNAPNKKKNLPG